MKPIIKIGLVVAVIFCSVSIFAQDPMSAKAQDFITAMNNGDFQKAYLALNSDLGFKVKAADLQGWWSQLTSKAGKFLEFSSSKAESKDNTTIIVVLCKFEKGPVDVTVAVDNMGKVAGMGWKGRKPGA